MLVILIFFSILIFFIFAFVIFFGAPYLPSFNNDAEEIIDKSGLKEGDRAVDLGCGDGRILVIFAKKRIYCIGYEINPILWLISYIRVMPYRKYAKVKLKNFWHVDLSNTDGVFIFLIDHLMLKLEKKLKTELKNKTTVMSYVFKLPNTKPKIVTKNSYIYKF